MRSSQFLRIDCCAHGGKCDVHSSNGTVWHAHKEMRLDSSTFRWLEKKKKRKTSRVQNLNSVAHITKSFETKSGLIMQRCVRAVRPTDFDTPCELGLAYPCVLLCFPSLVVLHDLTLSATTTVLLLRRLVCASNGLVCRGGASEPTVGCERG
jgi:hypothetical protein